MSPAQQGKAIADITFAVCKVLIVAGLIAWTVKRKGYRLLTFSIVCVIFTTISAYYFFDARQKAQEKSTESNRQLANNLDSLQKFIQNGGVGDIPEFKPTGDTDLMLFCKHLTICIKAIFKLFVKQTLIFRI